jgi:hypothetical protein
MEQVAHIEKRFHLIGRLAAPFSSIGLHTLYKNQPKTYICLCLLLAIVGYLFIVSFPLLVLILPVSLFTVAQTTIEVEGWILFSALLFLLLLSIAISMTLIRLKFTPPHGPELRRDRYSHLYQVIDDIRAHYRSPFLHVDRVILCDSFEISLVKTPRIALPFLFTRTLLIGLPVLQTMKPTDFRALLARELARASMRHHYIARWLVSLLPVWKHYLRATKKAGWWALPVYWFFRTYTRLYETVICALLKTDILQAEHDVLDLINDQDFLKVVTGEAVVREYINNSYWPKIRKIALRSGRSKMTPHASMTKVIRKLSRTRRFTSMVEAAWQKPVDPESSSVSLGERIHNLGHHKPYPPTPLEKTAAEDYLGAYLPTIIKVMDKKWCLGFSKVLSKHTTIINLQ